MKLLAGVNCLILWLFVSVESLSGCTKFGRLN